MSVAGMNHVCVVPLLLAVGWAQLNRPGQMWKKEDYSFGSRLKRATEECSYLARNDDNVKRNKAIQKIKDEMNTAQVSEFYEEREQERKKSKQFYQRVEKELKKAVMRSPKRMPNRRNRPRRPLPEPIITLQTIPFEESVRLFKRSSRDPSFFQGSIKDHNNCFSRCVFARMELVDILGFPQESTLRKAIEDYIYNKKVRAAKLRRVLKCFDNLKTVAIDDNCIYSSRVFRCMRLDEPGVWS